MIIYKFQKNHALDLILAEIKEDLNLWRALPGLQKSINLLMVQLYVSYLYSQIRPALPANFLALRVWEGTGAIQDDKYNIWNGNNSEGMTVIRKEWH